MEALAVTRSVGNGWATRAVMRRDEKDETVEGSTEMDRKAFQECFFLTTRGH